MGPMDARLIAPVVGALVEHAAEDTEAAPCYRVRGWLCPVPPPSTADEDLIESLLFVDSPTFDGQRMRWCMREEATHLLLHGMACGTIAPVTRCRVIGMAQIPLGSLAGERRYAELRGRAGMLVR